MAQNTTAPTKKPKLLRKQKPMRRVILALSPCIAGGIYFFGWRSLALVLAACAVGFATEYLFCRRRKEPVTEAVLVTAVLLALIMPPTVPWHVLIIGTVFAVMFSKEIFGGFDRNIFNPAMAGRCFVYICFPVALTTTWALPATGGLGALDRWSTVDSPQAITTATPMAQLKAYRPDQQSQDNQPLPVTSAQLFWGRIPGTMGVTSALLILIGGIYLFITKTASRTIILAVVIPYAILNTLLFLLNVPGFFGPQYALLGGGFLLGAFFMATDPVSSPATQWGKIFYGIIIAVATTVIRNFSVFNGGLMFSILLGNMFAPLLDYLVKARQAAHELPAPSETTAKPEE